MRFQNSPFLSQLLEILKHPTSAEQPDLLHFRPADVDTANGDDAPAGIGPIAEPPPTSGVGPIDPGGVPIVAVLIALVAALAAALRTEGGRAVRRRVTPPHPRLPHPHLPHPHLTAPHLPLSRVRHAVAGLQMRWRGRRPVPMAVATIAATVATLGAATATAALSRHTASPAPSASAHGTAGTGAARHLATAPPGSAVAADATSPPEWIELLGIERGITGAQDRLAAQEAEIDRLSRIAANHHDDPDSMGPTSGGAGALTTANELGALVAAHDATHAALQTSLSAEYTLYRGAAADPQKREQLIQGAATSPAPEAARAITYNLSQVETQLSQEASIAAGEQKLRGFAGLSAQQLAAIRRGQPFIAPEAGTMVQGFGPTDLGFEPPYTFHGTFYPHFHTGVDIAAPMGTLLHAAADGVVVLATTSVDSQGHPAGYGRYVVIAHPDGFFTVYAHMDSIAVSVGQVVRQGQVIGAEGSTGNSTGPHVHFEIRHGDDLLDPAPLLKLH